MNPAAPTISAKSDQNTPETLAFLERPEINPLDYADFSIMDPSAICAYIGLKHSNTVVLFVSKAQTYKSASLRNFAITVANYFNPSLGYAFPSQERLRVELNTTRQTISKWTKELVESGYWHVERGSEGKANRFTLPFVEFAHIRAFMASEHRGERYIKGNGVFRTVIAESKQGAAGISRPYAAGRTKTTTTAETLRDPYASVPVPSWGEPHADELTHASAPDLMAPETAAAMNMEPATTQAPDTPANTHAETELSSATEPEPVEPETTATADTESRAGLASPSVTPEHMTQENNYASRSVTDQQTMDIVDSIVKLGLCLDREGSRRTVSRGIHKQAARHPSLSPAQLEDYARGVLIDGIRNGTWTQYDRTTLELTRDAGRNL